MKKRLIWIIPLVLIVLALLAALLVNSILHQRSLDGRPLVLILKPYHQSEVEVGKGLLVQVSSTAQAGIASLELWVDNQRAALQESPRGQVVPSSILTTAWVPQEAGTHTLIARSVSKQGVEGQASIQVHVIDTGEAAVESHVVQEGETLESLAEDYETTLEEIAEQNNIPEGGGVAEGDELIVPSPAGGEAPSEPASTEGEPAGEETPPTTEAPSPGSLESLGIIFPAIPLPLPPQPVQLTAEVLSLKTQASYESLHCYVSLAGNSPHWMPDSDDDPSTDETFESRNSGHDWAIAEHLADRSAVHLSWDENNSVPIDISCVGIAQGGTEAIKLGRILDEAEPDSWGITQRVRSTGGEGSFAITYLIDYPAKGPDDSITPPWNVRLDENAHRLLWDYEPNEGGRPAVDGFAILLNDTFQWTVPGSARRTNLPEQWFNLPCGDEYRFQVVAFYDGYPDGTYSLPSESASILGGEIGSSGCTQTVVVTFERLTTGDLPGHPSPVFGSFFANDTLLSFADAGLAANSQYGLGSFLEDYGSISSQVTVELPPGNPYVHEYPLWLGFDIYKGGNKVCAGETAVGEDELAGHTAGTVESDAPVGRLPDWCILSYSISPVGSTPVVDPGAPPPLPDLEIEYFREETGTGNLAIHVRNVGQASWEGHDLLGRVTLWDGTAIGDFTWPNVTIDPGQMVVLIDSDHPYDPAREMCVQLNPDRTVREERAYYAEMDIIGYRGPYCRPLPDLSIEDATWDADTGQLNITLKNRGQDTGPLPDGGGRLIDDDLAFRIDVTEGRPITTVFEHMDLERRDSVVLNWPLSEGERLRMNAGYTLSVNPEGALAELDHSNNTFQVEGMARLRLTWMVATATFCPTNHFQLYGENVTGKNTWDMEFLAWVGQGSSRRVVANWNSAEFEADWREPNGMWCAGNDPYMTDWFYVGGDEALGITLTADLDIVGHNSTWFSGGAEELTVANDFGGTTHVTPDTHTDCLLQGPSYYYDCGPSIATGGGCGTSSGCGLGDAGVHRAGILEARSEDITGYCWWSTSYTLYREIAEP